MKAAILYASFLAFGIAGTLVVTANAPVADCAIAWQARDAALQDAESLRHLLWHTQQGSVTPDVQAEIDQLLDGWSPVSWEEQYRLNAMRPGELR